MTVIVLLEIYASVRNGVFLVNTSQGNSYSQFASS